MVCPSRKNLMICKIIENKRKDKKQDASKKQEEKITDEEHQKRLKMLKDIGILKEDDGDRNK